MKNKFTLYIDQYGNKEYATTIKELRENCGGGKVDKMYIDKLDGKSYHVGYIVGDRWFTAYQPVEIPA
jgi:hypothetical protein